MNLISACLTKSTNSPAEWVECPMVKNGYAMLPVYRRTPRRINATLFLASQAFASARPSPRTIWSPYGFGELDIMVPAYAANIHKAKGQNIPP
jgi:hypothetical protein